MHSLWRLDGFSFIMTRDHQFFTQKAHFRDTFAPGLWCGSEHLRGVHALLICGSSELNPVPNPGKNLADANRNERINVSSSNSRPTFPISIQTGVHFVLMTTCEWDAWILILQLKKQRTGDIFVISIHSLSEEAVGTRFYPRMSNSKSAKENLQRNLRRNLFQGELTNFVSLKEQSVSRGSADKATWLLALPAGQKEILSQRQSLRMNLEDPGELKK